MRICGIYGIFNTVSGKVLVGSSKDINIRWKKHISSAKYGSHCNPHFQSAWTKYGKDAFEFIVLEECSVDPIVLTKREDHWMLHYNSLNSSYGYNMQDASITFKSEETKKRMSIATSGSKNHNYGKDFSKETRKKMSEARKKRITTDLTRQKLSDAGKGRMFTEEHKKKLSKAHKGKVLSEEHKKKMSERQKGKILSKETRKKMSETQKKIWAKRKNKQLLYRR